VKMPKQKQATKPNENFSKILDEIRNLAIAITKDRRVRVKYVPTQPTSAFNMENFEISLSLQDYPDFVRNHPRIFRKVLDGDTGHECGHLVLTKPNWEFFNNWATKIKRQRGFYRLAHEVCNIVEDKRVNWYIIHRYRFDVGKRLLLANLILKDMIDNTIEPRQIQTSTILPKGENLVGENLNAQNLAIQSGKQEGVYMVAILINEGLYDAKCTKLWNELSPEAKADTKKALKLLEDVVYKRVKLDIIRSCQEVYDLVSKHLKADYTTKEYVVSRRGGNLKGEMSDRLKELLEAEERKEEQEEEQKKQKEDLLKGCGAGEGTGEEIPAPEPDFEAYSALLEKCKPEITELLNLLKKKLKPRTTRQIFQKRGRFMSPIVPRIYTNSLKGTVRNVYTKLDTAFEKEQVAIQFWFDFSGSVSKDEAEKITTILNEVFGHYVDDYGFSIGCFGADTQKIKTFFETFENTRARIGAISVNSTGTEISVGLEASLKMFNTIKGERRKILVIASDFCFSDEDKATELIEQYARSGIECMFIGFCSCENVEHFAEKVRGLKCSRTQIDEVSELPLKFLQVYLNVQLQR
jgi:hypothetical protein